MLNVVTIAREYGSGGSEIGRQVADTLGWKLLDKEIIERVAKMGKVDQNWCGEGIEQSYDWWERVLDRFRWPEVLVGDSADAGVNRDALQVFTARVIEEAGKSGNCVIVGRGSQCVLRNESRALRVAIYAPTEERLERIKSRHPGEHDLMRVLRQRDADRAHYVSYYYNCDSSDHSLYHLCLNTTLGIDACAQLVVNAVRLSALREQEKTAV